MDHQIDVAGAEQPPGSTDARERRGSGWMLLAAGALGVMIGAIGVLIVSPDDAPTGTTVPDEDASLEAPETVVVTPGTVKPPPSLAELVPGLTSDLVAFGFTPSGQAVIQQWFINATEPRTIEVPFGFAIPDQSGQWIAALASQRYGDSFNLHVGNSTYQEAIATDVESVVWSVDEPGRIAWTERTIEGTIVFVRTLGPGDDSRMYELPVPSDTRVVWLDGDQLIVSTEGMVIALHPDGTEIARLDDAEFVTATDGWAVVELDGNVALVDTDLAARAPVPLEDDSCVDARFGRTDPGRPSVTRLAVVCGVPEAPYLEILEIDMTDLTFTSNALLQLAEPAAVSWLDGDRFIAVPQPDPVSRPRSTISILDVETGEVTDLQWPGAVLGVIGTR